MKAPTVAAQLAETRLRATVARNPQRPRPVLGVLSMALGAALLVGCPGPSGIKALPTGEPPEYEKPRSYNPDGNIDGTPPALGSGEAPAPPPPAALPEEDEPPPAPAPAPPTPEPGENPSSVEPAPPAPAAAGAEPSPPAASPKPTP